MALLVTDRPGPAGGLLRTVALARPEKRNALDAEHLDGLRDAFEDAGQDGAVRVVVLAATGTAFSAGYDLTQSFEPGAPDALVIETMAAIRRCPRPTIACVQGAAFGAGLELALSCDFRLATAQAFFCLPPAKLGIAYAPEGLARLAAIVGLTRAKDLAFTGRVVAAAEALRLGLIDEVLADAQTLEALARKRADALAETAPNAVSLMKRIFGLLEPALDRADRAAIERERTALFFSDDAAEGLTALATKRPPVFQGK